MDFPPLRDQMNLRENFIDLVMRTGSERSGAALTRRGAKQSKAKPYGPQLLVQFLINNVMSRPFLSPKTAPKPQTRCQRISPCPPSSSFNPFDFILRLLFHVIWPRFFYLHGKPSVRTRIPQTSSVVSRRPSRLTSRSWIPKPVFMFQPVFAGP